MVHVGVPLGGRWVVLGVLAGEERHGHVDAYRGRAVDAVELAQSGISHASWLLVASAESNPHALAVIQACSEASTKAKWPAPATVSP